VYTRSQRGHQRHRLANATSRINVGLLAVDYSGKAQMTWGIEKQREWQIALDKIAPNEKET
jgi:hypothetical protein